jgi:uncharacterized protein (DUF433 family)
MRKVREFGKYIIADPRICHGALTFRGTRIFVDAVLEQVAQGDSWDKIVSEWRGSVPREAIAEAIRLAHQALTTSVRPKRAARRPVRAA